MPDADGNMFDDGSREGAAPPGGGRGPRAAGAGPAQPGYEPPSPDVDERYGPRRSLLGQVVYKTLGSTGARLGAFWVGFLILLAVFAPFLASSHPLLMRAGGRTSSPLLASLTWIDLTLLVLLFTTIAMVVAARVLKLRLGMVLVILLGLLGPTVGGALLIADPPRSVVYERYRQDVASGEIQWAFHTLIPFSPNDRQGDAIESKRRQPPSSRHWLGTTIHGEDMLSRMIHASRVALGIGFVATGIAVLIGIMIGAVMGYFAGKSDLLLMRGIEIVEVIPPLILLLIVTTFFGKDIWLMMVTIGLVSWTHNARFIRAEFLRLRKQDFVQACVATGLPVHSLLFRHMLPNGVAPVLVNASFGVASAILLESTLSFLGLGLEAHDPSWGQLLNQARSGGTGFNWWIATFPGMAIFLTVFAYILIGESLRDSIDPRTQKREE